MDTVRFDKLRAPRRPARSDELEAAGCRELTVDLKGEHVTAGRKVVFVSHRRVSSGPLVVRSRAGGARRRWLTPNADPALAHPDDPEGKGWQGGSSGNRRIELGQHPKHRTLVTAVEALAEEQGCDRRPRSLEREV